MRPISHEFASDLRAHQQELSSYCPRSQRSVVLRRRIAEVAKNTKKEVTRAEAWMMAWMVKTFKSPDPGFNENAKVHPT
jgi:hypothetical protein